MSSVILWEVFASNSRTRSPVDFSACTASSWVTFSKLVSFTCTDISSNVVSASKQLPCLEAPVLQQLHWLPVRCRVSYKVVCLVSLLSHTPRLMTSTSSRTAVVAYSDQRLTRHAWYHSSFGNRSSPLLNHRNTCGTLCYHLCVKTLATGSLTNN